MIAGSKSLAKPTLREEEGQLESEEAVSDAPTRKVVSGMGKYSSDNCWSLRTCM